jgi:uncharacterized protein (TIGR00106 family)
MVIAEVSVVPIGTRTPSVSKYVAKALKVLAEEKGVTYELTSMGTLIEDELDEVLKAAEKMHECLFDEDIKRVVSTIKIDERRDKSLSMSYKVESVMKKL